ncbi:hypothetical protein ABFS82_09G046100 [Erythranthe guttata]
MDYTYLQISYSIFVFLLQLQSSLVPGVSAEVSTVIIVCSFCQFWCATMSVCLFIRPSSATCWILADSCNSSDITYGCGI